MTLMVMESPTRLSWVNWCNNHNRMEVWKRYLRLIPQAVSKAFILVREEQLASQMLYVKPTEKKNAKEAMHSKATVFSAASAKMILKTRTFSYSVNLPASW